MMATTRGGHSAFTGPRLRLARNLRGFTQTDLGGLVGVSHQFIGYVESGHKQPGDVVAQALGDALGFDLNFFSLPPAEEFRDEECFFRRRHSTPLFVKNQVLAHASLFGELIAYLETLLVLPEQRIPTLRTGNHEEIERAAEQCRLEWGLGLDVPVKNIVRVLENAGVAVTHFEGLSDKVDAFSRLGRRSIVVLNDKTPSRSRWDLAHEWGHLVMHGGLSTETTNSEEEANKFASAFLLPRAGFVSEFPRSGRVNWDALMRLKERWRVSLAALIRRAFDLHLINALQYRQAYKTLSFRGWLRSEPGEFAPDEPELVHAAFAELARGLGIQPAHIAEALRWRRDTFRRITGLEVPDENLPHLGDREKIVDLARLRAMRAKDVRLP